MTHLATTPFGPRAVTAGLLAAHALAEAEAPLPSADKYTLLDDLRDARAAYAVTDRDLSVLAALLSFFPSRSLDEGADLIVFPSNKALSSRAHGMAESTLRRHLAALVHAGLLLRHDSPNGKRYAARGRDGAVAYAYGFSLRPLLVRAVEIAEAADRARAAADDVRRLRAEAVVALRDAAKLLEYGQETAPGGQWDAVDDGVRLARRKMRRRLDGAELEALHEEILALSSDIRGRLSGLGASTSNTQEMSGNAVENERHHQNSKTNLSDSELCHENGEEADAAPEEEAPVLPLPLVCKACPDVALYAEGEIRHWHHLLNAADRVRPMMGISADAWREAKGAMGPERAAITIAAMLQRVDHIHNPGGYLRSLSRQAEASAFSPGPMVMALLKAA